MRRLDAKKLIRSTWPKVRKEKKNGGFGYLVDARGNGWEGKDRFFFQSKTKAIKKAKEIEFEFKKFGVEYSKYTLDEYRVYENWKRLLQKAKKEFQNPDLVMEDVFFDYNCNQKHNLRKAQTKIPTIRDAGKQWLNEKSSEFGGKGGRTLSKHSVREHKQTVKYLAESNLSWARVDSVSFEMVEAYFKKTKRADGRKLSQSSKRTRLTQFKMFFNWCMHPKRQWIEKNPCDGLCFSVEVKEVSVLENSEVQDLLNAALNDAKAKEKLLPWLVLGFFAGLRPTEAEKLTWEEIDWDLLNETGALQVRVGTEKSKTFTHYAELHTTGIEWLRLCASKKGQIGLSRRAFDRIREQVGLYNRWSPDCIRHTYASNWLSLNKSRGINTLAELMGNSPEVIRRHYRKAILLNSAEAYWKILPPTKGMSNAYKKAA